MWSQLNLQRHWICFLDGRKSDLIGLWINRFLVGRWRFSIWRARRAVVVTWRFRSPKQAKDKTTTTTATNSDDVIATTASTATYHAAVATKTVAAAAAKAENHAVTANLTVESTSRVRLDAADGEPAEEWRRTLAHHQRTQHDAATPERHVCQYANQCRRLDAVGVASVDTSVVIVVKSIASWGWSWRLANVTTAAE